MTATELDCIPLTGLSIAAMTAAVDEIDALTAAMPDDEMRNSLRLRRARLVRRIREANHRLGLPLTGNGGCPVSRGEYYFAMLDTSDRMRMSKGLG